jgi:ATP-dependent Clp protease ATP-binding subunit ClpC
MADAAPRRSLSGVGFAVMATTYRFPVLVWKDHEGWYTASLVEWDEPAGIGRSAGAALEQLRDYLAWSYAERPWASAPDFLDPELLHFKVPVRPEYEQDGRRYPCDESVTLRLPCVRGRQEHGLLVCALPTLGIRFYYYEADTLVKLVPHYVQQHLKGLTPRALARHLPPAEVALEQIALPLSARSKKDRWEPSLDALRAVAEPLGDTGLRRQFGRPWERDREVADLVRRLGQEKANVLLVGEPGSGKTTVLVEAVRQLERKQEEEEVDGLPRPKRRYWQTSSGRLIAGMKYLGQWEERCEEIIGELTVIGGVLCVENLLDLVREGGSGPTSSLASFFLPYLQRGELRLVGEVTPAELEACRRLLPGFADVLQVLPLPKMGRAEAVSALDHLAATLAQNLHLEFAHNVTDLVYHLFRRFVPYHAFPGKAAAFLTALCERVRHESPGRGPGAVVEVTAEHAVRQFVRQTGLPELFLRDELPLARDEVLAAFRRQVIGQEAACAAAANLVTTFKAGLNDPGRPVGVLLFCGPTGVGKTELAKALARFFFGHGEQADRLVRLDMSEYSGPGAAERLLQQPGGLPGELILKVRQQPFVVLLLDEIEKADPEVFDVLLSVFDEGRLTDRYGRVTTFRSAVIAMTSNLGAERNEAFGFGGVPAARYEDEAMTFFRPEFFNRLDAVVTFQPLAAETVAAITRKELGEIAGREGLARARLRLEWTDALVAQLAKEGFDPRYGARPLQRTLETRVVTPLARFLLENAELVDCAIRTDLGPGGEVTFAVRAGHHGSKQS